jgi:hypothetical protein
MSWPGINWRFLIGWLMILSLSKESLATINPSEAPIHRGEGGFFCSVGIYCQRYFSERNDHRASLARRESRREDGRYNSNAVRIDSERSERTINISCSDGLYAHRLFLVSKWW